MRTYEGNIMKLEPNQIFVFGSNTQGKHLKGAALMAAKYFGAIYGQAYGLQNWTEKDISSYAICTKDLTKDVHPSVSKEDIIQQIALLYVHSINNIHRWQYFVAYTLSTNLSGYTPQEMADMFSLAGPIPDNIVFNDQFSKLIDSSLWASKTD